MKISNKCYHTEIYSLFCSLPTCENYGPCCFNCFKKYHSKHIFDCYCLGTFKIEKQKYNTSEIIEKYINELKNYLNSLTTLINDKILILENYKNCNIQNPKDISKYDLWDKLTKIDDENFKITLENVNLKIKEKYYSICKNIYNFNKNYNQFSLEAIIDANLINNFNENFTVNNNIDKNSEIYFSPKFDFELISIYICKYNQQKKNNRNEKNKNNNINNSLFKNNNSSLFHNNNNNNNSLFNNNNNSLFNNNNNNNNNNLLNIIGNNENNNLEEKDKIIIKLYEENEIIFNYEIKGDKFLEYDLGKTYKLLKNKKYKLCATSNFDFEGYYICIDDENPFFNFYNNNPFNKNYFITPFSLLKIKTKESKCILDNDDAQIV